MFNWSPLNNTDEKFKTSLLQLLFQCRKKIRGIYLDSYTTQWMKRTDYLKN
jgi:hypothetical protein